jgi:hypothetical protein
MASILKVDTIQDQSGNNIINENADTITIGASGDTITIPSGATLSNLGTASGFGLTWQSVQTTGFTAVKGNAYPCNTTSAAFTVTLPATPSAGDQVQLVDYAGTFDTNALTIDPNGEDIEGGTNNLLLKGEREGVILTYIDSTQGWIATSGINEGTDALEPFTFLVDFLVIAGGGGGGGKRGGGGGAGGYREFTSQTLNDGTNYTVTVGAGGAGNGAVAAAASPGNNSVFSSFTSNGGGGGGSNSAPGGSSNGASGGSGGGGAGAGTFNGTGGTGNTPSTSPSQGNNGGNGISETGGGGGGANAASTNLNGGNGTASSITGTSVTRAGGGGGGSTSSPAGTGGTGGGGDGSTSTNGTNGNANTGGGGGGGSNNTGGTGGSGIVIIKYPDTLTISNPGGGLTSSTATAGGFKVTSFTAGTGTIQFN